MRRNKSKLNTLYPFEIIDAHAHISEKDLFKDKEGGMRAKSSPEKLIEQMNDMGVQRAVIMGIRFPGSSEKPDTNEFIARTVKRHKKRFVGFACVDPRKGNNAVRALEHSIKELGLNGLKLHPCEQQFYPNDPRIYPVIKKAVELRIPIEIHSGHGTGLLKFGRPIHIDELATTFPKATIIMLHMGGSKGRFLNNSYEALEVAYKNDNVFLETSWASPNTIKEAIELIGPERVVFGSDYGGGDQNPTFELLKIIDLRLRFPNLIRSTDDLELILGGNISRILKDQRL